jgi:hypothetical protein
MKKYCIIIILLNLSSCDFLNILPKQSLTRINNVSGFSVNIKAFSKGEKLQEIGIENSKYAEVKQQPGKTGGPFFSYVTDSLVIIFNNEKILTQYCKDSILLDDYGTCNVDNNLQSFSNPNKIFIKRNRKKIKGVYNYYISKEDYERAILIKK